MDDQDNVGMDDEDKARPGPIWLAIWVLLLLVYGISWLFIRSTSGSGCENTMTGADWSVLFLLVATAGFGVGWLSFQLSRSLAVACASTVGVVFVTIVLMWFALIFTSGANGCLS